MRLWRGTNSRRLGAVIRIVPVRRGCYAAVGAVGLGLVAWAGADWLVLRHVRAGAAARTGVAGLVRFMETHQPGGAGPGTPDAWAEFRGACAEIAAVDRLVWESDARERQGPMPD